MSKIRSKVRLAAITLLVVLAVGFLIPENAQMPVLEATKKDWNAKSFWYEPWGQSGVHKGIDIFAKKGQPVVSAVPGIVIYRGTFGLGGNVVAILGPKWRIHYYAHMTDSVPLPLLVTSGQPIGSVGTSGNAAGKQPHLHYAVLSIVPLPWRYKSSSQGWKRIFFLDPSKVIDDGE